MAAVIEASLRSSRKRFHSLKIDMTPMVDLGFLLITFFIFTTSMMEPTITKLVMPKEGEEETEVPESKIITAILDNDKVLMYEGMLAKAIAVNKVVQTDYNVQSGFGKLIRQKQQKMNAQKDDLMVAIKPLPSSSYQQVMNALDEMQINQVKRYAIVSVSNEEEKYLSSKSQ